MKRQRIGLDVIVSERDGLIGGCRLILRIGLHTDTAHGRAGLPWSIAHAAIGRTLRLTAGRRQIVLLLK